MLRITLHVNAVRIADYEVRNVGPNTAGRCRYSVRPIIDDTRVGDVVLFVEHVRDDGAHALAATVLRALSRSTKGPGHE